MILIRQRYTSSNVQRQAELDRAADINAASGLFVETCDIDATDRRLSFADIFDHAHRTFPGRVCVVANSDISFDHTLRLVTPLVHSNTLLALSRWEDGTGPSMGGHLDSDAGLLFSHSQDVWIFRGGGLPPFDARFQLGILACETRLAYEAPAAGIVVRNPAISIRTLHHHATNVRTYTLADVYGGPRYLPRLTTVDAAVAEGLVVGRSFHPKRRVVRLDGSPDSFAAQMAPQPGKPWRLRDLHFRSPIYRRPA